MARPDPRVYELAYDEAVRALMQQRTSMEELRGRAGLILSSAALVTSFLGGQAVGHGFVPLTWIAVALFVALSFAALAILWPRPEARGAVVPSSLIATFVESPGALSLEFVHRDLALHLEADHARNEEQRARLVGWLRAAGGLLAMEVLAWVGALAVTARRPMLRLVTKRSKELAAAARPPAPRPQPLRPSPTAIDLVPKRRFWHRWTRPKR